MSTRKIKDAVDLSTGEKVYYKGHAKATYMSDGRTVEDAIKTAGGGGGMAVVDHGIEDTTFTLTPNVIHKWGLVDSLTLGIPEDSGGIVSSYRVVFVADLTFVLSLPSNIVWANDEAPDFSEDGMQYEINIIGNRALWAKFPYVNYGTGFLGYAQNELDDYVITDYVISTADYGIECKATLLEPDNSTFAVIGGSRTKTSDGTLAAFHVGNKNIRVDWNGKQTYGDSYVIGTPNVISSTLEQSTVNNGLPIYLYDVNQSGAPAYGGAMKIYYFRVLGSDGTPNLDLRPYRNEEGVVGFKDLVSGKFYTSVNNTLTGA
jgi:hypothetical protein